MKQVFVSALVAAIVAFIIVQFYAPSQKTAEAKTNRAYEHVMATRTLRCAYAQWPPIGFLKDPNSGKMSGFIPEYLEAMAKNLNVKIEYTEETGYGAQAIEGLKANRFDAFCTGMNQNAPRGMNVLFTNPIFYNPIYAYVRADDTRFDGKDLSVFNDETIILATMDGEATDTMARNNFPKAKTFSLPQNSEMSMLYSNVAQKKADVVFSDAPLAEGFIQNNPNSLKRLSDQALALYTIGIAVSNDEPKLQGMLNTALMELQAAGKIKAIVKQRDPDLVGIKLPGFYYAAP